MPAKTKQPKPKGVWITEGKDLLKKGDEWKPVDYQYYLDKDGCNLTPERGMKYRAVRYIPAPKKRVSYQKFKKLITGSAPKKGKRK